MSELDAERTNPIPVEKPACVILNAAQRLKREFTSYADAIRRCRVERGEGHSRSVCLRKRGMRIAWKQENRDRGFKRCLVNYLVKYL